MSDTPQETIEALAARLDEAALNGVAVPMISIETPDLAVGDGYAIQTASMRLRFGRGERLVGMKMGLTSRAKMEQVGVHSPIYGHLTDRMQRSNGATLSHARHVHPRIEPEIAFVLDKTLRGPVTSAQAMTAVGGVAAALELIDSRYENFKFNLVDVVADNASSSKFVLGDVMRTPAEIDVSNLGMVMEVNGVPTQIGSSAAIYEHPAHSLAALANMLADRGEALHPGQIVLCGGATAAVALQPGDRVRLRVDQLGTVSVWMGA